LYLPHVRPRDAAAFVRDLDGDVFIPLGNHHLIDCLAFDYIILHFLPAFMDSKVHIHLDGGQHVKKKVGAHLTKRRQRCGKDYSTTAP
jgi:hypothetical protein